MNTCLSIYAILPRVAYWVVRPGIPREPFLPVALSPIYMTSKFWPAQKSVVRVGSWLTYLLRQAPNWIFGLLIIGLVNCPRTPWPPSSISSFVLPGVFVLPFCGSPYHYFSLNRRWVVNREEAALTSSAKLWDPPVETRQTPPGFSITAPYREASVYLPTYTIRQGYNNSVQNIWAPTR